MKSVLFAVVLLGMTVDRSPAAAPRDDRQLAAAAREILLCWQTAHARPAKRFLHVVCWTPSDREFPAGYRDRLSRMLLHIQNFYAEEMQRNGFGMRSFNLELEEDSRVVMHEVRGNHPTNHYEKKSGSEIRKECLPVLKQARIDADQETIAIFCNLANWDEKTLRFSHKSPYYAGGTYRSGTAWQLDSPELDTRNLSKTAPRIRDGEYGRISLGKHNSIFIGGMAHELGHAFGLPHVKARPDERDRGTALMGAGNRTYGDEIRGEGRGTFLTFAHALRLASHPQFSEVLETETNQPKSSLRDLEIRAEGKAIAVSGILTGNPPVYGLVAYFDPEGNADYNQTSVVAVPDEAGRFKLQCDALVPGRGVLKLVPLHANGAIGDGSALTLMRYSYRIANDGTPDLKSIQTRLALQPIVQALTQKNDELARRLAGELKNQEAKAIAAVLTDFNKPTKTPAEYRGPSKVQNLTTFKANTSSVGWARPTFNRIPEDSVLLESAGEIFATGIYAHAPARHDYVLGGRWKTFQGTVGIAAGHAGSVRFEIRGDGHKLWESPTVLPDQIVPFQISVQGIQQLELITAPTDDGKANDWGLWLEPQLLLAQE